MLEIVVKIEPSENLVTMFNTLMAAAGDGHVVESLTVPASLSETVEQGQDQEPEPGNKRKRRTKAEIEAEKAAAAQSSAKVDSAVQNAIAEIEGTKPEEEQDELDALLGGGPDTTAEEVTEIMLRDVLKKIAIGKEYGGRAKAVEILKRHSEKEKIIDIDPALWPKIYADCQGVLNAAA